MRTSFLTIFALGGLIASTVASPVAAPVAVDKRDSVSDAQAAVESLSTSVFSVTAQINQTVAGITSASSDDDKSAATSSVASSLQQLTDLVTNTVNTINTLSKRDLTARQDAASLTTVLEEILEEIFATLKNVIAQLGLTGLLGFLQPLVTALGNLILALVPVVNDLLEVVRELLDSLLIGLGVGLTGLGL